MASTTPIDPAATVASDISTTAVKDAPLLSTALSGEASSSTLPAPETIATSIADEKSANPPTTTSLSPDLNITASSRATPQATEGAQAPPSQIEIMSTQTVDAAAEIPDPTKHQSQSIPIDEVGPPIPAPPPRAKSLNITLLLISGARYPFTINAEYMSRHNVQVADQDPMQMGVFALKECIWKEWKDEEWSVKPPSANFIRLIHFGRLLDDRQQLKDCRLNPDTPNVVHMTVRPTDSGDDDATQRSTKMGFGGRDRERREGSSPSCRCVIL